MADKPTSIVDLEVLLSQALGLSGEEFQKLAKRHEFDYEERRHSILMHHKWMDQPYFDNLRDAIENLGGRHLGYYDRKGHFEVPLAGVHAPPPKKPVSKVPRGPRSAPTAQRPTKTGPRIPDAEKPTDEEKGDIAISKSAETPKPIPTAPVTEQPAVGFETTTPEEYDLKRSYEELGPLAPIILDAYGNVIDGFHRRTIDPNWPAQKLDIGLDPVQLSLARLALNFARRTQWSKDDTDRLNFLIEIGNLTPDQIAKKTGLSRATIYRHMAPELKRKYEKQIVSRETIEPTILKLVKPPEEAEKPGEITEKEPKKFVAPGLAPGEWITCSRCRDATREPLNWKGKPVCATCYKRLSEPEVGFEPTPAPPPVTGPEGKPRPRKHETDVGEFECPICHYTAFLTHVDPTNEHRFKRVMEANP